MYAVGERDEPDPSVHAKQLQKAMMLVAHTIQKLSYYRRLHALSSMGTKSVKNVREVLKEEQVRKLLQEDDSNLLVPTEFDAYLKAKEQSRKNLVNAFGSTNKTKKKEAPAPQPASRNAPKQKPFSSNPHQRGGGNRYQYQDNNKGYRDNNRGYNNNNPFAYGNNSNYRGNGKGKYTKVPDGQHAFHSRMAFTSETRNAMYEIVFPSKGHNGTFGGKNPEILSQLENDNPRSSNSENCQGLGNSIVRKSLSSEIPTRRSN